MKKLLLCVLCILLVPSIVGSSVDMKNHNSKTTINPVVDERQVKMIKDSKGLLHFYPLKKKRVIITQEIIEEGWIKNSMIVEVSFYNPEDPSQTDDSPGIMAWLHEFQLGDKVVAVSQDFVAKGILDNGDIIEVTGFGSYVVRDKMNKRYENTIDIAISDPNLTFKQRKDKALKLGRKKLLISWLNKV